MDPTKKISFGFSKSKPLPIKHKSEVKANVQYIDCIERKSIKIKGATPVKEEELIIPVNPVNVLKNKYSAKSSDEKTMSSSENSGSQSKIQTTETIPSNAMNTLEDIAVREILEDSKKVKESAQNNLLILQPKNVKVSETESSITDYEDVPVTQFGLAMLRGMGWKPEKGIGKNEKVVEPTLPLLRPKGMGLGADKRKITAVSTSESEDLELKKGSYVLVLAGSNKNTYGQVQSFDEDAGRVIIKTALGGTNISVNESMIQVVSKDEYKKSSRVVNLSKYEECKRREEKNDRKDHQNDVFENKRAKKHYITEQNGRHSPGD